MDLEEIKSNLLLKGITDRNVPNPGGSYVAVNVRGNIAYVAIQFPIDQGILHYAGKLGKEVTTIEGYQAARIAAMNILGQIEKHLGFEKIEGLNHLDIYYAADGEWNESPTIADGASDLFLEVLGDKGRHTRALFGVERLPGFACVGVTGAFTVLIKI